MSAQKIDRDPLLLKVYKTIESSKEHSFLFFYSGSKSEIDIVKTGNL